MKETIADRIQQLIKNHNETATHIMLQLGLSPNALSEWKKGKAKPSADAIIKIAKYFDVSTDYLLTGKISNIELSEQEQELLYLYRKLPEKGKERMIGYMDGFIDANNF